VRQIFPVGRRGQLGPADPLSAAGPVTPATAGAYDLIAALGEIYAYPEGRWLRANMIASVDGAIMVDGRSGGLSGPADRLVFRVLRSLADVIVVGAGTARAERYRQAKPGELWQQLRTGRGSAPPIAVLTRRLDLDLTSKLFGDVGLARTILITTEQAPQERLQAAARVADVVVAGAAEVGAATVINVLEQRGYRQILLEGGPSLLGQFTAADLLDELCLTISPVLEGGCSAVRVTRAPRVTSATHLTGAAPGRAAGRPRPGHTTAAGDGPAKLAGLRLANVLEDDGFLLTRYVRA
jgi:riboflavin biosynthesis pyrimidine reductase